MILSINAVRILILSVQYYCRMLLYNTNDNLSDTTEACLLSEIELQSYK